MNKRELERRRRAHSIALLELGVAGLVLGLWALLTGYLSEYERGFFSRFGGPILLGGSFYVLAVRFKRRPSRRRRPDQQGVVLAHAGMVTVAAVGSGFGAMRSGDLSGVAPCLVYLAFAGWVLWLGARAGHFRPAPFGPKIPLERRAAARRAGWVIWLAPLVIVPISLIRSAPNEAQILGFLAAPGLPFLWYGGLKVRLGRYRPSVSGAMLSASLLLWCFMVGLARGSPHEFEPILYVCAAASVGAGVLVARMLRNP